MSVVPEIASGKEPATVPICAAPRGKYRVVGWVGNPRYSWIEGDFDVRRDAVACADGLKKRGADHAAIYNDRPRCVYSASDQAGDLEYPISVTRLAGQSDPVKRGSHRRK